MATRKKRIPVISLTQFVAIVTATIALTLLFNFATKINTYAQIEREATRLQERLDNIRAEHESLLARREYVQSNEYVEKIAREELNWIRFGDNPVMIKTPPQPLPTLSTSLSPTPPSEPTGLQWSLWWATFFGDTPPIYGF
jgi:cell division protein FtsB